MAEEFGERTEAPTAKRKRDAVDQGDVLQSREFGTALVVLAGVGWIALFGRSMLAACKAVMIASLTFDSRDVEDFSPLHPLGVVGSQLLMPVATLFAFTIIAALGSRAGLGSFGFNLKLLAPKASRINPASGLKRVLGPSGWIELAKSLLKVVLLGTIGGWMLWKVAHQSIALAAGDLPGAVASIGGSFTAVLIAMAAGLAGIAMLDVPIQIVRLLGKLRMTKQEIKDEHKETEGSPELKGQLRARQRDIARRNVRKAVESAHVVLTNPTHFAVALRYDRASDQVPVVVAKGRGVSALAIRDVAGEAAVPVLEYPQLARAVYYTSREGQEIRDDLYQAIAAVLAFVFGLDARVAAARQPAITVPETARFDENGVREG